MSITRRDYSNPRLTDINRREDIADRRKVASVVMACVAVGLFATIAVMIWAPAIVR